MFLIITILPIIYLFFKYKKAKKNWIINDKKYPNKIVSDFWLNKRQKEQWFENLQEYKYSKNKTEELKNIALRENLSRNLNGSISNRSNRGKEINNLLSIHEKKISVKLSFFSMYRRSAFDKWSKFNLSFGDYNASKYSIISYLIMLYYLSKYYFKIYLLSINDLYSLTNNNLESTSYLGKNPIIAFILITLISYIGSFIINIITQHLSMKFIFEKKYKQPPIVNHSNFDFY